MSDELSDRPVGDDDPTEPVRGRRIAETDADADGPAPDAPLTAPALPPRVAEAIAESESAPDDYDPLPPPSSRSRSRRAAWADNRAARIAEREAAIRHAQDEVAEAARARAMEEEQAALAARHAATIPSVDELRVDELRVEEPLPDLPVAVEEPPVEEPPVEEPLPVEPDPRSEPAASEGEDYARRWAEAEASILRAQEAQRLRTERALASPEATPVESPLPPRVVETVLEEQVVAEQPPLEEEQALDEEQAPEEPAAASRRAAERPERRRKDTSSEGSLGSLRSKLASLVWLVAVLAALVLAVGALVVALELSPDNTIVKGIRDAAEAIDFGVFREFTGEDAATRAALVNWGIAAVIWLVVGKVLDKLIRA